MPKGEKGKKERVPSGTPDEKTSGRPGKMTKKEKTFRARRCGRERPVFHKGEKLTYRNGAD